jgi:hypothetical protein
MKIPSAAFLSPTLRYDLQAQVVVFERLNPDTGEVAFQVPSPAALKEQERAAAIAANQSAAAAQGAAAGSQGIATAEAEASAAHPPATSPELAGATSPRISLLV